VGVEVRLEHQLDGEAEGVSVGEVLGDVALRVDHDRPAGRFVADQVGRMREALEVVLLEDHGHRPFSYPWGHGHISRPARRLLPPGVYCGTDRSRGADMELPDETVADLLRRLRRVEGQVRGIQTMLS